MTMKELPCSFLGKRKRHVDGSPSPHKIRRVDPIAVFEGQHTTSTNPQENLHDVDQDIVVYNSFREPQAINSIEKDDLLSLFKCIQKRAKATTWVRSRLPLKERKPQEMVTRLPPNHPSAITKHTASTSIPPIAANVTRLEKHQGISSLINTIDKPTILTPCHICQRAPKMKTELDRYCDCECCQKRTCYICIRQCEEGLCGGRHICNTCCVEEGEDGWIACLDCLSVRPDVEMRG